MSRDVPIKIPDIDHHVLLLLVDLPRHDDAFIEQRQQLAAFRALGHQVFLFPIGRDGHRTGVAIVIPIRWDHDATDRFGFGIDHASRFSEMISFHHPGVRFPILSISVPHD